MSDTAGSRGEARASLNMRLVLTAVSILVGLPLSMSLMAGLYGFEALDPFFVSADVLGLAEWLFAVEFLVAFILYLLDYYLERYIKDYKSELYDLLKDIGEQVKAGMAVEAAVSKTAGWKSSAPAKTLQRALKMAEEVPFEAALRRVSIEAGQPAMHEVGTLMATAIETEGDIGSSLRWLGTHFSKLHQNEKEFTAKIESSLRMLRGIALMAAPFLYYWLQRSLDNFNSDRMGNDPNTIAFFTYGVVLMSMLDGLVYSRWERVPSKLPLYLAMLRLALWEF